MLYLENLSFSDAVVSAHKVIKALSHSVDSVEGGEVKSTKTAQSILNTIMDHENSSVGFIPWATRAVYATELERLVFKLYENERRIDKDRAQALLNDLLLTKLNLS